METDLAVGISIGALAATALLLAGVLGLRWRTSRSAPLAWWSAGLALVALTIGQEVYFFFGGRAGFALQSYLFLIALLVGVLSIGSAELGLKGRLRRGFEAYIAVASVAAAVVCFVTPIDPAIIVAGVVSGNPPLGVLIASSLVTVPATLVLAGVALVGIVRHRRLSLLPIVTGILVISAAGGLYVASFPATLYYAEFVGVLLLFFGFVRLGGPSPAPTANVAPTAAR